MISEGIKNINYQASFYHNYEFEGPRSSTTISPYSAESASVPLEGNLFISNHLQKPMFEQDKYHDIYCSPTVYQGLYPVPTYSNDTSVHLVSPEWRQTISQSNWDPKMDPKNSIRSNPEVDEQYFRKSNIINSTCVDNVGPSTEYRPLDSFPRNINHIKGSQYYYPSVGFGNSDSRNLSRIGSNYSSDNSSFSSLSPKISFDINKSSKVLTELSSSHDDYDKLKKTHIKKPLNAFMLFMKEMRSRVVAECTLKESAAINQILGRRWHALTREEQTKYYEMARKEKELHQQLYPNWSARDNYASHTKRKKKRTNSLFQMSYFNHGNCFKTAHTNAQKFPSSYSDQEILNQNSLVFSNKRGLLSNHNFFYKPDSPYHIDPILAIHYGSSISEKLAFSSNQQCLSSNWSGVPLQDHSINGNKDSRNDVAMNSSQNTSKEPLLNDSNIITQTIPNGENIDLEMVINHPCRKPHLVSESVF